MAVIQSTAAGALRLFPKKTRPTVLSDEAAVCPRALSTWAGLIPAVRSRFNVSLSAATSAFASPEWSTETPMANKSARALLVGLELPLQVRREDQSRDDGDDGERQCGAERDAATPHDPIADPLSNGIEGVAQSLDVPRQMSVPGVDPVVHRNEILELRRRWHVLDPDGIYRLGLGCGALDLAANIRKKTQRLGQQEHEALGAFDAPDDLGGVFLAGTDIARRDPAPIALLFEIRGDLFCDCTILRGVA